MPVYVHVPVAIRPGRLPDAIKDIQEVNAITKRLAGITGQLLLVSYGGDVFGGAHLLYEFESNEAVGRWDDAAAADPDFQGIVARVTGPDSAWVVPAPRE